MKPWEIVESIHAIGYVKTFEKITQKPKTPHQSQPDDELAWEEIVERNRRKPLIEREPGEEG